MVGRISEETQVTEEEVGKGRKMLCCMKFKMKAGCCKCGGHPLRYCGDGMANWAQQEWKRMMEKRKEGLGTGLKPWDVCATLGSAYIFLAVCFIRYLQWEEPKSLMSTGGLNLLPSNELTEGLVMETLRSNVHFSKI